MPAGEPGSTRAYPRVLAVAAALLLAIRIGTGMVDMLHPSPTRDLVRWTSAEVPTGAVPGQPVLYYFSAEWCRPCRRLQQEVFADPDAAKVLNEKFLCVRVDAEDDTEKAQTLRQKYQIDGLPTLIVSRAGGDPLRLPGYRGRRSTMAFLTKAAVATSTSPKSP